MTSIELGNVAGVPVSEEEKKAVTRFLNSLNKQNVDALTDLYFHLKHVRHARKYQTVYDVMSVLQPVPVPTKKLSRREQRKIKLKNNYE